MNTQTNSSGAAILCEQLTKDYGHGRGVFDVSIAVQEGECYGFLGPNGAGKTTTIRHLMGFSRPDRGDTSILGMDSWAHASELKNTVGYLPGEVTLPVNLSGTGFLKMMARMRGVTDLSYERMLLERFELDPDISIKQMSLGVKRKLAVVTAFMHDPDILILDEPTSGLDPVMQQQFIEYVEEEKSRGKTIFLSSHIFHEVDATCDRIAIIKGGRIVSEFASDELKNTQDRIYRVSFRKEEDFRTFIAKPYHFTSQNPEKWRARVQLPAADLPRLIADVDALDVRDFIEIPFTLEDYFMEFYETDEGEGVGA